jgi:phosphoserine aminotransferase
VIRQFVVANDWIDFLAVEPETLSNTSVCLTLKATAEQVKQIVTLLDENGVAYDVGAYRDAPSGLRIWCGATVEESDVSALMPWLTWAYQTVVKP